MRIGFRVDASLEIGTGHVMRCLTLADALCERGAQSIFFCRLHAGNLIDLIEQRGHEVVSLPPLAVAYKSKAGGPAHSAWLGTDWENDAAATCNALGRMYLDWIVVDHYALDLQWEQVMRPHCRRVMVIDDLADRPHDCDLLLDQNLGRLDSDYYELVADGTVLLMGPRFALLRPEFARLRPASLVRRAHPKLKRLLITLGGVDKDNVTGRVLAALDNLELPEDLQIIVVMGRKAPYLEQIRSQAVLMRRRVEVLTDVTDMATLMTQSDLAIGAAGGTSWERCCMGLPTLILVLAENQKAGAVALQNTGAALAVEHVDAIGKFLNKLLSVRSGPDLLMELARASAGVADGAGASRICEQMMQDHG